VAHDHDGSWIEQAASQAPGTDFDWLLAQLQQRQLKPIWSQLYNAADLWLTWDLGNSRFSKSRNVFAVENLQTREAGMRRIAGSVKDEIMRPVHAVRPSQPSWRAIVSWASGSSASSMSRGNGNPRWLS